MTAVNLDSISEPEPTRAEAADILATMLPDVLGSLRDADTITQERDLDQARRILSTACRTDLEPWIFAVAASTADRIVKLRNGADLRLIYGCTNTEANRERWIDSEQQDLNNSIRILTQRIKP